MFRYYFSLILLINVSVACSQKKTVDKNENILHCILLGYDSIAFYHGESNMMLDFKKGNASDPVFIKSLIGAAKEYSGNKNFLISIKPTASADVFATLHELINVFNINDLQARKIDSLDDNEKRVFNTVSAQEVFDHLNTVPRKLQLPKAEPAQPDPVMGAIKDRVVILIYDESGIYIYQGEDMKSGKKNSIGNLKNLLAEKKVKPGCWFLVKSSQSNSYKNTVDVLDELEQAEIKKYSLVDISPEEEAYLIKIR